MGNDVTLTVASSTPTRSLMTSIEIIYVIDGCIVDVYNRGHKTGVWE
jgi:hypothetical protein